MAFSHIQPMPGVYHIQDCMGVCMTLLVGKDQALLIDAGYGLEDVSAYVRTLTDLPVRLILTHGHHDHVLGARWFPSYELHPDDFDDFCQYTGEATRARVLSQASDKGLSCEDDLLAAQLLMPIPLQPETVDLGGMTAQIISCPGHTPGSIIIYVPEYKLLITDDDWNPCTWLFFRRALAFRDYLANMQNIILPIPAEHVLCSHRFRLYPVSELHDFIHGLTDETLAAAIPQPQLIPEEGIDPRECSPAPGQVFVFDWNKYC